MLGHPETTQIEKLKQSAIRWIAGHGIGVAESEDIYQQAVLKAIATDAGAESNEKVSSWFYQILKNTMIDEFRRSKRDLKKINEYALATEKEFDPETVKNLCQCVSGFIEDLPKLEKTILEEHFFNGESFKELAIKHDLKESTLRVKALRAREKLKEALKNSCGMKSMSDAENCECD